MMIRAVSPEPAPSAGDRKALIRAVALLALKGESLRDYVPECGGYVELIAHVRNSNLWGFKRTPSTLSGVLADDRQPHRQLTLEYPPPPDRN